MLQDLLSERFELRFHPETRSLPVYHLVVSKRGLKLKPEVPVVISDDEQGRKKAALESLAAMQKGMHVDRGFQATDYLRLPAGTIAEFAARLRRYVDRPVIDWSQLDQRYSFTLAWVRDGSRQGQDAPLGPSLVGAVEEQLGLKLLPGNDQLQVLVIDGARRIPTEN